MCWSLGYAYIFCEFGERSSDGFDKLYDGTCELDWYSFPIKVQQIMPIIMNAGQKSATIRSSRKIQCTREFFKGVSSGIQNGISNSFSKHSNAYKKYFKLFTDVE